MKNQKQSKMISKTRKYLLILSIVITIAFLSFYNVKKTVKTPNAGFMTITGKKIKLSNLSGKPIIITFWATDCATCVKEIPHLIDLYNEFHPAGLEIIAVAMYYDPPSHVVEMAKIMKIPYDIALDLKAEHARAFGQVELTPTTFLITPKNEIIMQITGAFNLTEMKDQIKQMTAEIKETTG